MINIPYIAHVYGIKKMSSLVENIDAPVAEINLALWHYEENGSIEIDRKKDKIKVVRFEPSYDRYMLDTIQSIVAWYNKDGRAVNRNKIVSHIFGGNRFDPPRQDFFCTLDAAVENGDLFCEEVSVGKAKFVVYWVSGYDRDEMVNNFISDAKASRKKNKIDV